MANYSHQHNLRGRRPAPPPPLQPIRDAWMFNNSQPPRSSEEVCLISKWSFRVFIFTNCYIFFSIEFCTQKSHESVNIHIGPDHVQLTKVNWRLKVNWKIFQEIFCKNFPIDFIVVNHVLWVNSIENIKSQLKTSKVNCKHQKSMANSKF